MRKKKEADKREKEKRERSIYEVKLNIKLISVRQTGKKICELLYNYYIIFSFAGYILEKWEKKIFLQL